MIKCGDIIWPSKWMSKNIKLTLVGALICGWFVLGAYKCLALGSLNTTHIVAAILVYAIYCFIYDKDYPIGTIALNFEDGSEGSQIGRFLSAVLALVFYLYVMFSSSF